MVTVPRNDPLWGGYHHNNVDIFGQLLGSLELLILRLCQRSVVSPVLTWLSMDGGYRWLWTIPHIPHQAVCLRPKFVEFLAPELLADRDFVLAAVP